MRFHPARAIKLVKLRSVSVGRFSRYPKEGRFSRLVRFSRDQQRMGWQVDPGSQGRVGVGSPCPAEGGCWYIIH